MDKVRQVLLNHQLGKKIEVTEALEIYKEYHESIEKNYERRLITNSFFLSLHTAILAFSGYLFQKEAPPEIKPLYLLLPIAGIIAGIFWLRLIVSYRQLNTGKFDILHLLEEFLPLAPYKAEWEILGKGEDKKKYYQITLLERWIPILFVILYGLLALYYIYLLLACKITIL